MTDDFTANPDDVRERLEDHIRRYPHLAERIHRELLMELHRRGVTTIDNIHDEARQRAGESLQETVNDPNQPERDRWDERERDQVERLTQEYVGQVLQVADVDDLVNLTLKREEVESLEYVATRNQVSFRELAEKIRRFCQIPLGETRLAPAEVVGTRVALIRHFISDQLEFIGIAKHHLQIRHFDDITRRMIGNENAMGRVGGKAAGMILAHCVLTEAETEDEAFLPVSIPDSYFLRSDVVGEFLRLNRLDSYQSQKYKPIEEVTKEYPLVRGVFRNGDFPLRIIHALRRVLDRIGNHPLVVRSSSLLEDRWGTAFCGKYNSVFLANQGPLEQRVRALLGAIAEIYASILAPDPILYRREHNLLDYVEEMAVLIQRVVGVRVGNYLFPPVAGVAFSRNEYRWSPRIKREDGMMRLVMGLGTRAVDRSGSEYPRMVALGEPTLRPESSAGEIMRCAQRTIDVVDFEMNRLQSIRLQDLPLNDPDFPMLDRLVSVKKDGELYMPTAQHIDAPADKLCITFDKLVRSTPFVERMRTILTRLEDAYEAPVDVEFASDGQKLYLLQCRTLAQRLESGPVTIPHNIPEEDVIFDASRYVRTGEVHDIRYIVYVAPEVYNNVETREHRVQLARVVGRINRALPPRSFILIGPGRWGSSDIRLGLQVHYADISQCCVLIEVARQSEGFCPEVSFGTHFFQDLVEAGIHYLPLYPDENGARFNEAFLNQTPNALASILPQDAEYAEEIRVIHIPAIRSGRTLSIAMDGEADKALAYVN